MSILNKIRGALENHLLTMVGVPTVYPSNTVYDPDPNTTFIKSAMVVTNIEAATRGLNPQIKYSGFYNLLVCTPEGNGMGASLTLAEAILDRFTSTTDISFSGIILTVDNAAMSPDYFSAPFNCLPITVNWYIYHPN